MYSAYTDQGFQFQTYDNNDDHQHGGFDELLLAIQLMPAASANMGGSIAGPLRDPPPPPPPPPQQVVAAAGSGSGRKRGLRRDRHSKIVTAKGPRDRRMRLSLDVAKKFFYLQDVLGFDKASKTVDWLLTKSNDAIRSLPSCASGSGSHSQSHLEEVEEEVEEEEEEGKIVDSSVVTTTRTKPLSSRKATSNPALVRESRAKARARARERTREKKIFMSMTIHQQQQQPHESSVSVDYPFSFFQEYAGNSFQQQQQLQQQQEEREEEEELEQEQEQEGGVLHPYFS